MSRCSRPSSNDGTPPHDGGLREAVATMLRPVKSALLRGVELSDPGFRLSMRLRHGARADAPRGEPEAPWHNSVLLDMTQVRESVARVRSIGLPLVDDLPKNWDCLAALDVVRRHVPPGGKVFDAGGETYSMILPWLYYYGYRDLTAGNLVYDRPMHRASIRYQHADITRTDFAAERFDAITCLSVVEHGVDLAAYFAEMARLLVPGGHLVTSTDYFDAPTDCRGQQAYGTAVRVFDRAQIEQAIRLAGTYGLELTGPLDLTAKDRVVHWREVDLRYTFLVFTLRKKLA